MELLSGIHQADDYSPQNILPKNTGAASTLPRIEDLLTGVASIDAIIKSEYDKLVAAGQKQITDTVPPQPVQAPAIPQNQKPGQPQVPGQGADITKKKSAFPPNVGWWSA
jgi:hypothetical protein